MLKTVMTHPFPISESPTFEFKSDRGKIPDSELVHTAVCLAVAPRGPQGVLTDES
jgi:hypothetical protein